MLLLFLDTETGGVVEGVSVLTITFTAFEFGSTSIIKVSELDLKVRPDDSNYVVNPVALAVNGINLQEHHKVAISYTDASKKIYSYLAEINKQVPIGKPVLVGQNVQFDINHLTYCKIISKATLGSLTDIRVIDTVGIAKFAQILGLIPLDQSLSLGKLAKFLEIPLKSDDLHSSAYDNEVTAKVLFELGRLFKGNDV